MQVRVDVMFPFFNKPAFCDQAGNSPLHYLALKRCSLKEFSAEVNELFNKDNQLFLQMLTTSNNDGKMPFQLIDIDNEGNEKLYILSDYLRKKPIKPLDEKINIDAIIAQYYPAESTQVKTNLRIASEVVNEARSYIKESHTHPHVNSYATKDQEKLLVRLFAQQDFLADLYNDYNNGYKNDYLKYANKLIKKDGIGNCDQFSLVASSILMSKFGNEVYAQRYRIEGGDHVFLILDDKYKVESDKVWQRSPVNIEKNKVFPINHTSLMSNWWSPNAVVCDAWAGDVYPVREMPYKLNIHMASFEKDRRKTNWLGPVNSTFHFFQKCHMPGVDDKMQRFYSQVYHAKIRMNGAKI